MEQNFYVESQGFLLRKVSKFCLKVIRNKKKIKMSCHIFVFCIYFSYLLVTVCYCLLFVHFFVQKGKQLNNKMFNVENIKCIKAYFNVTIMCRYRKNMRFFFGYLQFKKKNK